MVYRRLWEVFWEGKGLDRRTRVDAVCQVGYDGDMVTFAQRLRELRGRAGLTQVALAEAAGLPLGSIRNYEQGQREPSWENFLRLIRGLGVPAEAFAPCVEG